MQSNLSTLLDDSNSTTGLWDDTERKRALNSAYFEFYNLGVNLGDGMGEEMTSASLTQTSGTATIALPADFYKMVSLYYTISATETYRYIAIHPTQQHQYRRMIPQSAKQLAFYIRGSNIVLVPTPTWSGTLTIEYSPEPTEMSDDADEPVFPKSHRELIVYGALIRLREKEGVEVSQGSIDIYRSLRQAFERDMEDRQSQESRRLNGPDGYGIYETRI
jgi:hypothetical protein